MAKSKTITITAGETYTKKGSEGTLEVIELQDLITYSKNVDDIKIVMYLDHEVSNEKIEVMESKSFARMIDTSHIPYDKH